MSISILPRFAFVDQISTSNAVERLKSSAESGKFTSFSQQLNLSQNGVPCLSHLEESSARADEDSIKHEEIQTISHQCVCKNCAALAISDIPPLQKHERPAVGTFVHPDITPGFKYWVRKNGSLDHLFSGKSVYLEDVSQCCGKRFTFECDDNLGKDNFFWSDSNMEEGFAFAVDVVSIGDRFDVATETESCGVAEVLKVSDGQEILYSSSSSTEHVKEVQVNFRCRMTNGSHVTTTDAAGIATVRKLAHQRHAELLGVMALFLPCGGMHSMTPK